MAGGSIDGRAEQAAPTPERPRATQYQAAPSVEIIPFISDGAIAVSAKSSVYEIVYGGRSLYVVMNLFDDTGATETLSGTTTVAVKLNGSSVGTVSVASGASRGTTTITQTTVPEDRITVESTAVGTGTAYATVQIHVKR